MSSKKQDPRAVGEEAFTKRADALFRASVDELDAATRSRLNKGRQAALSEIAGSGRGRARWTPWVPATGVAAAAAVAIVMWSGGHRIDTDTALPVAPFAEISDFDILLDQDELEMLEDLEFYLWLGTEDGADVG